MKLGAKAAPAPAEEPTDTAPAENPADADATQDTSNDDLDFSADSGAESKGDSNDKPFDDEPFDAGVEADEESDPKKFIEQLTGKLGQSLRKYTEDNGQPDFELEKFAVNSLLSATHTGEMDSEDQKDIIKKVKKSGKGDDNVESSDNDEESTSDEKEPTGDESGIEDTGGEKETKTPEADSENMFETEMLDEMSLNDYVTKELIKLYDESEGETRETIFRKVTYSKPFEEKDEEDKKINRAKFLEDLSSDFDKEHLDEVMAELKEMGIYNDPDEKVVKMFENSFVLQNPPKNSLFQEETEMLDEKKKKGDRCTRIAKRKYDTWPSAYASGAVVKCRKGKIWKGISENELDTLDELEEKWSEKYKRSIDCNNPKGFSQKAHCQGRKKHE